MCQCDVWQHRSVHKCDAFHGPVGVMYVCVSMLRRNVSFGGMLPSVHIDLFAYLYLSGALSACS